MANPWGILGNGLAMRTVGISRLKCSLANRCHHLLRTFWGWRDKQLIDGTVIWTLPSGQIHVTLPGSALIFPTLCAPTGELAPPDPKRADRRGDPTAMMPKRKATRAENRARYITAERARNLKLRQVRRKVLEEAYFSVALPSAGDDPPPF